jgi:hypothetical protein
MDSINDTESRRLKRKMAITLCFAGVLAAALPIAYWVWFGVINEVPPSKADPDTWGTFGDFVGGILNPTVAFFALFWLTRSIAIQREELRDSKLALQSANQAQSQQAETLEKQRFEDTFFALLEQHNKVLELLSSKHEKNSESELEIMYELALKSDSLSSANAAFRKSDDISGHYFRILYQVLKLTALRAPNTNLVGGFTAAAILGSQPSYDEKLYSNIVRSFLNNRVTQLLAINCFAENEESTYWNYKCLVERYQFLEHMPFEVDGGVHPALRDTISHYSRSAFGKSEFLKRLQG